MQIITQLKDMNNKSRKGLYIYAKSVGYPGRYYKYKPGIPESTYITRYKPVTTRYKPKTYKKKTKYKKRAKVIKPKKKKITSKQIKKLLTTGYGTALIRNLFTTGDTEIQHATEALLSKVFPDKKILKKATKQEFLENNKQRFEYNITLQDRHGNTIAQGNTYSKTPRKVIQELKETIKQGQTLGDNYRQLNKILSTMNIEDMDKTIRKVEIKIRYNYHGKQMRL